MATALKTDPQIVTTLGWLDRLARRVVTRQLGALSRGEILLRHDSSEQQFGQPDDLRVTLQVHHPRFFRRAVLGGTLSIAESYLQGDWDCDDLTSLFRIIVRNRSTSHRLDSHWTRLAGLGHRLFHRWHDNTRRGSQDNIAAHYDLGNEFYQLWLDDTLAYSSAIFPHPGATLHAASLEKFDRVCRKLDLRATDQVLEIGSGWGGFAIHAAGTYGCQVTTTTISRRQFLLARQRIAAAELSGRIKLLEEDYRDLRGAYDKLVSIEMIEAVGHRYLDQFFGQCGRLLRADGTMVLQAIVMPDRGYEHYLKSVDFIQRYVFPGGCLPSLATMLASVGRTTDLRFVHAEDFAPHYAETLRRWQCAFQARLEDVRRLGYSERFVRLWNYYLSYCQAAFEERCISVLQLQFDKPRCRRDPIQLARYAAGTMQLADGAP
jgi:cyclopropane-fatty-acyl-phospholipid synthase